jgi:hypothetical protein
MKTLHTDKEPEINMVKSTLKKRNGITKIFGLVTTHLNLSSTAPPSNKNFLLKQLMLRPHLSSKVRRQIVST